MVSRLLHREWPSLFPINAIIAFWPTLSIFSILWFCLQNYTVCAVYKNWVSPDQLLDHSFLSHTVYARRSITPYVKACCANMSCFEISLPTHSSEKDTMQCCLLICQIWSRACFEQLFMCGKWVTPENLYPLHQSGQFCQGWWDCCLNNRGRSTVYLYQHLHMPAQLNIHFGITCLKSTLSKPPCLGLCSRTDPLFLWITVLPWHPQFWASQSVCGAGRCCHWSMVHHIHHDSCTTVSSGEWCVRICDWIVCITLVPCKPIE